MEKTNSVPRRLLILGNGFYLGLGRDTRYSDFVNSRFWLENLKSELFSYLEEKANLERWFDLESELAKYIQTVRKESSAFSEWYHARELEAERMRDKEFFDFTNNG